MEVNDFTEFECGRIRANIKSNLNANGIYDEDILKDVTYQYLNTMSLNIEAYRNIRQWRGEFDSVMVALQFGANTLYNQDGSRYLDLIRPVVSHDKCEFNSIFNAVSWATNWLDNNPSLPFSVANDKLGKYKTEVYKRLCDSGRVNMASDGLYNKSNAEPMQFLKKCPMCNIEKPSGDFLPGRAMCKECYNAQRRTTDETVTVVGDKHTIEIKKMIKKFNADQKRLMASFIDDTKRLQKEFKLELEDRMEDIE